MLDLRRGADIIIATPGRLMDLLGDAPAVVFLSRLKFMVSPDLALFMFMRNHMCVFMGEADEHGAAITKAVGTQR